MYLTLDLSLKCSGWAKFTEDGKLAKKGRIRPSKELTNFAKIHYIAVKIRELFQGIDKLIIEDLYLKVYMNQKANVESLKWLARLSGAVITEWVDRKYTDPKFYKATTARKLVGINGHAHKVEIQLYVLNKYSFVSKKIIKGYNTEFEKLIKEFPVTFKRNLNKEQKKQNKLMRGKLKYRLGKLSEKIDKETNIGEDIADAIILGLAYQEDKNVKR